MKTQFLLKSFIFTSLAAGVLSSPAWAQDETAQLRQQIAALQNQVNQLQLQLGREQAPLYDQWGDPFAQMMLMQQQMDQNMRQAFAGTGVFNPKMDIKQTPEKYIITVDLPGMDKDKIDVESQNGMLTISGERQSEQTRNSKADHYYRHERSFGTFMQAIPLPDDARKNDINADYKNGVLTVTVGRDHKGNTIGNQSQKITVR